MSRWIRRVAYVLGTLVVLIAALAGFVFVRSNSMMAERFPVPAEPVSISTDSITLARGEHLVNVIGKCTDCHGDKLGGKLFFDDPAMGHLYAPNLTKGEGGVGNKYTDAGLGLVIRHGIKHDSTSAWIMPAESYQYLADDDLAAIVAYIRAQPPVAGVGDKSRLGPVGRALAATHQAPVFVAKIVDQNRAHPATVIRGATAEYGQYLSAIGGCSACHGPSLSGAKVPGPPDAPMSSNITPKGIGHYTDAQLETVMRTGMRPDGTKVKEEMPWRYIALMTDEEMSATIKYLRALPSKEYGAP